MRHVLKKFLETPVVCPKTYNIGEHVRDVLIRLQWLYQLGVLSYYMRKKTAFSCANGPWI